jgi:8-oxo-dGTP pyrophosphatase MutT (NUDIX family)
MAFEDFFRVSAHAVITNADNKVLMLKATYAEKRWGLPGGSVDPNETLHETVLRECQEEIGAEVRILYLSGVYYHARFNSHSAVFRCELVVPDAIIKLSDEHDEYDYFSLDAMSEIQRKRVLECLNFDGTVKGAKFL